MDSCIRSVRDDHLIVYFNGIIMTKINDSYNRLKYGEFMGNRVAHNFDDEAYVQETYDDRIFNCVYKGERMQIRIADKLCDTIVGRNKEEYIILFKSCFYEAHKIEILTGLVKDSFGDRVKMKPDDSFVIDDRFMVDTHATAHYLKRSKAWKDDKWSHLCIVAKAVSKKKIKTRVGMVEIDVKLLEILAKINFLLYPNVKDTIFTNQLPEWLMKSLVAEQEVKV